MIVSAHSAIKTVTYYLISEINPSLLKDKLFLARVWKQINIGANMNHMRTFPKDSEIILKRKQTDVSCLCKSARFILKINAYLHFE